MLLSTAHALRERIGAPLPPVDRAAYDSVLAACRASLARPLSRQPGARSSQTVQEVVEEVLKEKA